MVDSPALDPEMSDENPTQGAVSYKETVYLIESPSPDDLLSGRNEGDALRTILKLAEIDVVYYLCVTLDSLDIALGMIAESIIAQPDYETAFPFIHISAHGGEDGIELTDGDVLLWDQLTSRLEKLNDIVGTILPPPFDIPKIGLCLSSCGGFENYVKHDPDNKVYQCIVGPTKEVGWCQSLIAFSTFYYRSFTQTNSYDHATNAMNIAAGLDAPKDHIFKIRNNHDLNPEGVLKHLADVVASLVPVGGRKT